MIKDTEYYLLLDLELVAKKLPSKKDVRLRSEELGDIINSIFHKIKYSDEKILVTDVKKWLGEPDQKETKNGFEIWSYKWIGKHGDDEYESATPFKVSSGVVIEIAKGT